MMFVRYVGPSTVRIITRPQWEDAGVKKQGTVTWQPSNTYVVLDTELTEDAIAVLARDPYMIFVGTGRDPAEELEARIQLARRRVQERAISAPTAS
jgi:hypothetical protein